jgi:nucleoside-diphosphate-sugar epimerase
MVGRVSVIAVTGVSGYLGQQLLARLAADPDVERVVGIDAREPRLRPASLDFHLLDIASADLEPLLDGADALVHLAFLFAPQHDEALMARVNLDGTRRVLDAAGAAGIRTVVYLSSATVYGAWPENPVPLTEDAPLRPNPGFVYAWHKAETERLVGEWRDAHPDGRVAVLRPAVMLGPHVDNWVARALADALPFRIADTTPPVQYVHEDDVVAAVLLALRDRLDGPFNVAPDGWIPGDQALALAGTSPWLSLPASAARRVVARAWKLKLVDVPPEALPYLEHPWVVANDRLRRAGWEPTQTNEETFVATREAAPWQELSPQRRQELALVASAALLVGGAVGLAALVRRRRRRRRADG